MSEVDSTPSPEGAGSKKPRRAAGTGSVGLHKPTGLWRAVARVNTAQGRKRVARYAKSEAEAYEVLQQMLGQNETDPTRLKEYDPPKSLYFIQAGDNGPIKIGVARNFEKRLASMQSSCPELLIVLKVIPSAGHSMEKHLHRYFAAHRLRGEWFSPHPDVLDFVFAGNRRRRRDYVR
jgi:hypothetical protein